MKKVALNYSSHHHEKAFFYSYYYFDPLDEGKLKD